MRRQYSAEEKICIVLEGLRGEENISELCRRKGIAASMYYGWFKEFLETGKRRLAGDTVRSARAITILFATRLIQLSRRRSAGTDNYQEFLQAAADNATAWQKLTFSVKLYERQTDGARDTFAINRCIGQRTTVCMRVATTKLKQR
jgi:transposase-like protein